MSIEVIPEMFREPFDPIGTVDHETVRLYTQTRVMSDKGVRKTLQELYTRNYYRSPELIERLVGYGKFLEPIDEEFNIVDEDMLRTRVFGSGIALALTTTANMAYELEIAQRDWRDYWTNLPDNVDAPITITIDEASTPNDCYKIGAAIISIGQRNLTDLEAPYRDMLTVLEDNHEAVGAYGNIFQSSFGYGFGVGRRVLRDMAYPTAIEEEVLKALPDVDEPSTSGPLDDEYRELLAKEGGSNV